MLEAWPAIWPQRTWACAQWLLLTFASISALPYARSIAKANCPKEDHDHDQPAPNSHPPIYLSRGGRNIRPWLASWSTACRRRDPAAQRFAGRRQNDLCKGP